MSMINDEPIRALCASGKNIEQIAKQVGFKPMYVYCLLVFMGIAQKRCPKTPSNKPHGWLVTRAAHNAASFGQRIDRVLA